MRQLSNLLAPDEVLGLDTLLGGASSGKLGPRGCDHCPLDKPENQKFISTLTGKKVVIVTGHPTNTDAKKQRLLSGPAARLLWAALKKHGISRQDCDIQAVVRCRPSTNAGAERKPTIKETHCCSIHTDRALKVRKARVYLLLGYDVAQAFLGQEFRKDRVSLWSKKLSARVVISSNPAVLLQSPEQSSIAAFDNAMRATAVHSEGTKEFSILRQSNYKQLSTAKQVLTYLSMIVRSKERISVDIEDGYERHPITGNLQHLLLCIGFCHKPGVARVVFIDHPKCFLTAGSNRTRILRLIKRFLANDRIKKTFHHGVSDTAGLGEHNMIVGGYDYDTEYADEYTE